MDEVNWEVLRTKDVLLPVIYRELIVYWIMKIVWVDLISYRNRVLFKCANTGRNLQEDTSNTILPTRSDMPFERDTTGQDYDHHWEYIVVHNLFLVVRIALLSFVWKLYAGCWIINNNAKLYKLINILFLLPLNPWFLYVNFIMEKKLKWQCKRLVLEFIIFSTAIVDVLIVYLVCMTYILIFTFMIVDI